MPTYQLTTAFAQQDLSRLYAAGANVVVAKPNAGGRPNVAWIVFRPLISNVMAWEDKYGIYASSSQIMNGQRLVQMAKTEYPAVEGKIYSLTSAGFFGPPSTGGSPGAYSAVNEYNNLPKGYLTFGLFQDAQVDGVATRGNAVSATPVIFNSAASVTPFTTVYLWIQSQVMSNTVISNVTSPITEVRFGGAITEVSLMYDPTTGTFVPARSQSERRRLAAPPPARAPLTHLAGGTVAASGRSIARPFSGGRPSAGCSAPQGAARWYRR